MHTVIIVQTVIIARTVIITDTAITTGIVTVIMVTAGTVRATAGMSGVTAIGFASAAEDRSGSEKAPGRPGLSYLG